MGDVQRGEYLGIHEAAGVPCHHLTFEQATIDWQLWIDAGKDPLPRKLVITYKTEDEVPQYTATIRKWNLEPRLPDALFVFTPPDGAARVEVAGIRRPGGAAGGRSAMSRHQTISVTLIALVIGSTAALEGQRSRGSVSSARGSYSHSGNTGSVQGQRASGTRTVNQTGSGATATRQAQTQSGASAEHDQGSGRREPRDQQDDDRHHGLGRVGHPVPRGRGSRWLRDHRGERAHQHRAFGLRRSRGGPHLLRPAGGRRNGQHEIQRHLQRRRRPHAVWRVEHRGGRSVRRTCDDDVAIGVQDVRHITVVPTTRTAARITGPIHMVASTITTRFRHRTTRITATLLQARRFS